MTPWLVILAFVALANLFAFVAIRGRWDRLVPVLAVAAIGGTALGDAVAGRTGIEVLKIGDFHVMAASVVGQLAMLAVTLLAVLVPGSDRGSERGSERGSRADPQA
jgi:hypothetical protein